MQPSNISSLGTATTVLLNSSVESIICIICLLQPHYCSNIITVIPRLEKIGKNCKNQAEIAQYKYI